jgi:subtilase family serine protease
LTHFGNRIRPSVAPQMQGFLQGSGGGESVFLKKPAWQRKLPGTGRQLPDISAIADPQTGAIVVETDPATGVPTWFTVGGISLATPIFSAIWALADEAAGESSPSASAGSRERPGCAAGERRVGSRKLARLYDI